MARDTAHQPSRQATPRTKRALQGAALFALIMAALDVVIFFVRIPPPGPGEGWILMLGLAWLFPAAFLVWWAVFRDARMPLWHAAYAGLLIGLLWVLLIVVSLMAFGLATQGADAAAATARIAWVYLPAFVLAPLDGALKFIAVALFVRWRQLKRGYP